jgi:Cys-rich repeat protein
MLMVAVIALASCKARSELPIGEECTEDKQCAEGLYCQPGVGTGRSCLKPCGASTPDQIGENPYGTSCPKGWSCSAVMKYSLEQKDGTEMAAWGGLRDHAVCVPDGWTPPPKPTAGRD